MSQLLFKRRVVLQLNDESFECGGDGLRCTFRTERSNKGKPNKAHIEVYGVSFERRVDTLIWQRELRVRLFVGFGDNIRLIFEGNPIKHGVQLDETDPERRLIIDANDCLRKYQTGRVNFRIDGDTTLGAVVPRVLRQIGLPVDAVEYDPNERIENGFRADGTIPEVLNRLSAIVGAEWSFQSGRFQFVPFWSVVRRGPKLSSELGNLIGVPQQTDKGVRFTALLEPDIEPNCGFELDPFEPGLGGFYKAVNVQHTGDTWGGEFYTKGLARRLKS